MLSLTWNMERILREFFNKLLENRLHRVIALLLAVVVTFTTTYTLVLPAITLDMETSETMSGISLGGNEQSKDASASPGEDDSDAQDADDSDAETVAFDAEAKNEDGETEALVHVEADADVFPEGTTMEAAVVTDQAVLDEITEAAEGEVVAVHAVDLTFTDENGETVQPLKGSQISVTLSAQGGENAGAQNGSDVQDAEDPADPVSQEEELREAEPSAEQNTETMVVQYTDGGGAAPVELNSDVSFQVEPETDLDQDSAVSFELGEQSGEEETQTYAIVETVPENDGKENRFPDAEEEGVSDESGGINADENGAEETEEPQQPMSGGAGAAEPAPEEILPEEQEILPEEELDAFGETVLTARDDSYIITVTCPPEANIPQDAYLHVEEIQEKETYDTHLEETRKALNEAAQTEPDRKDGVYAGPDTGEPMFFGARSLMEDPEAFDLRQAQAEAAPVAPEPEIVYARFFDITILDGSGNEVDPGALVKVAIELLDAGEDEETIQSADAPQVIHFGKETELMEAEVIEDTVAGVTFDTPGFSVYGVVYTVDFYYEANDKMYEFSIPGGGFISLEHVVEMLGIARVGDNGADSVENTSDEAEDAAENDACNEVDETGAEGNDANGSTCQESIDLNHIEVSEETKKFVADVVSVEFSSPELVWVGKADETTTVGELKEANGLEVQYSAELTEEQIAEINSSTIEAGDWALISLQPFTSEETLTVTMKTGEQFVVKVTDAQITSYDEIDRNRDYIIYVEYQGQYYALRNDGESVPVTGNDLSTLGSDFIWNFDYDRTSCWWISGSHYIDVDLDYNPVAVGNTWRYSWTRPDGQDGFDIVGYAYGNNHLSWNASDGFIVSNNHDISIKIYEKIKPYHFTVESNNEAYGSVECSSLETTAEDKKNQYPIYARTANRDCYFIKWQLNGNDLNISSETIDAGQLTFTEDNMVLTAVFGKSYSSPATQHINEWVEGLLGNPIISDKTAHLYDYDNRIYEIDLSASSKRYTVDKSITLEFLTDASRSMYFPAQVTPVEGGNYGGNLANWLRYHGDESQVYYTVADVGGTATMYAVYYQKRYTDDRGQWFAMDASYYYDGASEASAKSVLMVNSKRNNNYREDITNQIKSNNNNQTFTLSGILNTAPEIVSGQDWTRLDYLKAALTVATRALYKLDPDAQVGVLTFAGKVYESFRANANNEATMLGRIDNIALYGGTNQKVALDYYWDSSAAYNDLSIFTNTSKKKQVAILITDGAPNTTSVNWGTIGSSATNLKNRNVELYTLGLSLDDVGTTNQNGLNGIATDSNHAYQAQQGEEFAEQIETMLRQILDKAALVGEITDTIDASFYPVY